MIRWVEIQWHVHRKEDRVPWELNWKGWYAVYITCTILLSYQWVSVGVSHLFDMETKWIVLRNWLMLSLSFGSWLNICFLLWIDLQTLLNLVIALWKPAIAVFIKWHGVLWLSCFCLEDKILNNNSNHKCCICECFKIKTV